jgi:membrane protein
VTGRFGALAARFEAYSLRVKARLQDERERHVSVDLVFRAVDRDAEVGGGILAGALAYRLFVWMLPLIFVAVAGLGFYADASSQSPSTVARSMGVAGIVSNSIADAARGSTRWYALVIGVPVLLYATRTLLRSLIVVHRLVWAHRRSAAPRPTVRMTLETLVLLLSFPVISGLVSAVRAWSSVSGVLASLIVVVPYAGFWLVVSTRLPRRDARWPALLPGAVLFAAGLEGLRFFTVYFLASRLPSLQQSYGPLGIAAALFLGLFVIGRLVVLSAVTNAVLWERRTAPPEEPALDR